LTNYRGIRPALEGYQLGDQLVPDVEKGSRHALTFNGFPSKPTKGSDLWNAYLHGISPATTDPAVPLRELESPSRETHQFNLASWRYIARCSREWMLASIENNSDMSYYSKEQELAHSQRSFFAAGKQRFGTIFAASGLTRRPLANGRLDWVLIQPLDSARTGKNCVFTYDRRSIGQDHEVLRQFLKAPFLDGLFPNGNKIHINGAGTGRFPAELSRLKVDVTFKDDKQGKSEELAFCTHNIFRKGRQFGDAGSVAFDGRGRVMGLLLGEGHQPQRSPHTWTYITPIQDVLDDIKLFSGGLITDIHIAEDKNEDSGL